MWSAGLPAVQPLLAEGVVFEWWSGDVPPCRGRDKAIGDEVRHLDATMLCNLLDHEVGAVADVGEATHEHGPTGDRCQQGSPTGRIQERGEELGVVGTDADLAGGDGGIAQVRRGVVEHC